MIVTPFLPEPKKTYLSIACPTCGKGAYTVEHLSRGTWTRWYCDEDECGYRFELRIMEDGNVDVTPLIERKRRTTVTLRCRKPFTLKVDGLRFLSRANSDDDDEGDRFYYEQNTCPMNIIRSTFEVYSEDESDDDPHGLFTYVKTEVDEEDEGTRRIS